MSHTANRRRLPSERVGITRSKEAAGFRFHLTVNFFEGSSDPGEVFIHIAKEGSTTAGLVDSLATTISVALQYGVPWDVLSEKYLGTRFGGHQDDKNPSIVHALAVEITEAVSDYRKLIKPGEGIDQPSGGEGNGPCEVRTDPGPTTT